MILTRDKIISIFCLIDDVIEDIAAIDADVIIIECSRSQMELLDAFSDFKYPNDIGPGVYDIHSPTSTDKTRNGSTSSKSKNSIATRAVMGRSGQ